MLPRPLFATLLALSLLSGPLLPFPSCAAGAAATELPVAEGPLATGANAWIEWDRASDRVVSAPGERGAAYPRARQLSNGEILLAYHQGEGVGNYGARVTLRRSRDGGANWYRTEEVEKPEPSFWGFCNPDFIELGRGRMLLVTAARGRADASRFGDPFASEGRHSGLRVRFSEDYGLHWSAPQMLAAGRGRVWEPSIARLPGGEIQIFYAVESPALMERGVAQGLEVIRSPDGGRTWSAPSSVAENAGCRNGMPAALALANGHVACAQEIVGLGNSPYVTDTFQGQRTATPLRLTQDQYDFGAAPFLTRTVDGGTLLAFHSQMLQSPAFKRLSGAWLFSQIYVQRGDAEARNFGPASCPWPETRERGGAFFPSLLVLRDGTVVALASFITLRPDRTAATTVRWVKGRMIVAGGGRSADLLGNAGKASAPPARLPAASTAGSGTSGPALGGDKYRYGPPASEDESTAAGRE